MDLFGKYVAQKAAQQAKQAASWAQQKAAMDAALRARQAATGGASAGVGAVTGYAPAPAAPSSPFANLGQVAAQAAVQSVAPPPPPTIGQVIAQNIVDRAQSQAQVAQQQVVDQVTQRSAALPFQSQPAQAPEEPWQLWRAPDGNNVVMPTSYTPPQDWTAVGDEIAEPDRIERARGSVYAYDNQPDEVKSLIVTPQNETEVPRPAFDLPTLGQRAIQQAQRQGENLVQQGVAAQQQRAAQSSADLAAISTEAEGERRRDQAQAGLKTSETPYVRVQAARTGEVYTIPRERLPNIGPDDRVLGPALTQPESSQDRSIGGMPDLGGASVRSILPTANIDLVQTVEDMMDAGYNLIPDLKDTGSDIIKAVDTVVRDPMPVLSASATGLLGIGGDMLANVPNVTAIINNADAAVDVLDREVPGLGPVVKTIWDNTPEPLRIAIRNSPQALIFSLNFAVDNVNDGYINMTMAARTGGYKAGNPWLNRLQSALSIVPAGVGERILGALGQHVQVGDSSRGISQGKNFNLQQWLDETSQVTYPDGVVRTVSNEDIAAQPDIFGGLKIVPTGDIADAAYVNGIDVDGDGTVDMDGVDAVNFLWREQLNGAGVFLWETGADPLNYLPAIGAIGRGTTTLGKTMEAAAKSGVILRTSRAVQGTGRGIEIGARVLDEASALGLGVLIDQGVIPIVGKVGEWVWLGRETNLSRQATEVGDTGAASVGVAGRATNETTADLLPPVTPLRPEGGAEPQVIQTTEAPGLTPGRPAPATSQPTPDLDPGPDLRTPDGGTLPTRVADGEGGFVEREVNPDGGVRATSRSNQRYPVKTTRTAAGTIDTTGVDPRYTRSIERAAVVNGPDVTQAAVDAMRAGGRFVDHAATQRSIGDALVSTAGTVDHALLTTDFAIEWNAALANAGGTPISIIPSNQGSRLHRATELILDQPWETTGRMRRDLYNLPVENENAVRKTLPANASPEAMASAERYADLVDEHLRRNPQAINSPKFQADWQAAQTIRKKLQDAGFEGRPTGAARRGNLLGGADSASLPDSASDDLVVPDRRTEGGFANQAQTRKPVLPGEQSFGEIAGQPVINERRVVTDAGQGTMREVRLDADTTVEIRPVAQRNIDASLRREFPGVDQKVWYRADLIDDSIERGTVAHYAPTEDEAVQRALADAEQRGLLDTDTPSQQDVTPQPENVAETPRPTEAASQPEAITGPSDAATGEARPPVVEDMGDTAHLPTFLQRAVKDEVIGAEAADAFRSIFLVRRNMTEDDAAYVLRALQDIRAAHGSAEAIPVDIFDMVHPAHRQFIDDAVELAQAERALRIERRLASNDTIGTAAQRNAKKRVADLDKRVKAIRTRLGWTDETVAHPTVRIPNTDEVAAQRRLRSVVTRNSREDAYIGNLRKMQSLEYTDAPAGNLTMDSQGFVRFEGALLTGDEIEAMTRHLFDNGETFLDRWNRYLTEARGGKAPSKLSAADEVSTSLDMALNDYQALMKQVYPSKELSKAAKTWARITQALREKILGNWLSAPRYIGNQVVGNPLLMAMGGYGPADWTKMVAGTRRSYREMREMRNFLGIDPTESGEVLMHADSLSLNWGAPNAPEVRRHVSSETDVFVEKGVTEQFLANHKLGGLGKALRPVTGDVRVIQWGAAVDMSSRDIVYSTAFTRQMRTVVPEFRIQANEMLMATGMSRREAVEITGDFARRYPDHFTANDVRTYFKDYLPDGQSERLARDFQSAVNGAVTHGRNEVKRVLFAGKRYNADTVLSNVVLFHYFLSRQLYFFSIQALHHPGLINTYLRYNAMMDEYADNKDVPPWLRGFIRFTVAGPGVALYLNPMNLLSVGPIFGDPVLDFNEDQTWLQKQLDKVGDFAMLHPLILDAFNVTGYLGDRYDVDPLRLRRDVDAFNLIWNWGVHKGWISGDYHMGNPVIDAGNMVREKVSSTLNLWGNEPVEFIESANKDQRLLQQLITDEAKRAGITDEGEIDAIITDPTHPVYRTAMARMLWKDTIDIAGKMLPFRAQTRALNKDGDDLLMNTTAEDRRTGNVTDDRARGMKTQSSAYYAITSKPTTQVANIVYNDIVHSERVFFDVTVDGKTYTHDQINAMSDDERKLLAKGWLVEQGLYHEWGQAKEQQDIFLADPANAEFATFKRWQAEVYDYPGGPEAYWKDAAKKNDNAAWFLENLDEKLPPEKRQKALTNMAAYQSVAGIAVGWKQDRDGNWYATSDYKAPKPKDTNGYDPVNIANQPPSPTPYEPYVSEYNEDLKKDLNNYQKYRARDEVVLQQIYADWGMSPDTRLGTVPYKTRQAIEKEFKARTGDTVTKPSYALADYFEWRDSNPNGTLDDYIRWRDYQYEQNLPASFTEEYNRPEGEEREDDAYRLFDKDKYRG